MPDLQRTREVTTAVQKARETRRRIGEAGAGIGETALLSAIGRHAARLSDRDRRDLLRIR